MKTDKQQQAERKLEWIKARVAEERIVSVSTPLRSTQFTEVKHLDALRVKGESLQIREGKRWVSADYCKLTAL